LLTRYTIIVANILVIFSSYYFFTFSFFFFISPLFIFIFTYLLITRCYCCSAIVPFLPSSCLILGRPSLLASDELVGFLHTICIKMLIFKEKINLTFLIFLLFSFYTSTPDDLKDSVMLFDKIMKCGWGNNFDG